MNIVSSHISPEPRHVDGDDGWTISIIRPYEITSSLAEDFSQLTTELCGKRVTLTISDVQKIVLLNDVIVAIVDNTKRKQLVGMAVLVKMQLPQGMRLLVESVVVLPIFRKRGIAKGILTFTISHAKSYSRGNLSLTCNPSRKDALRLYDALGFVKAKTSIYRLPLTEQKIQKPRRNPARRYDDPSQPSLAL